MKRHLFIFIFPNVFYNKEESIFREEYDMFKTKKIEINGITIEVKDGKKSPQILITSTTDDVDVVFNGQTIFSTYEKEEYQYIPKHMRAFIEKHTYSFDPFEMNEAKTLACDISLRGEDITAYFPSNAAKPIPFRFNNIPDGKEYANEALFEFMDEEEIPPVQKEVLTAWETLRTTLESIGYAFQLSHYSEGYFGWWDIVIPSAEWDEEKFFASIEAITAYKQIISKYDHY